MRRWRLRLLVLGAGAALSAASAPTLSAWFDTTSTPTGNVTAIADWAAPVIHRAVIQKSQGGKENHVRAGGNYRLCARVATTDSGNPATGIPGSNWVTSSLTNLTSTLLGLLNLGTTVSAPCAVGSDNRAYAQQQVTAGTPEGTRQIALTTRDVGGNTRTKTIDVTIDNTRPTADEFSTVNKTGGTKGLIENGDKAVFRYSEPIDPNSVIGGWDGSSMAVTAAVVHSTTASTLDYFSVYQTSGTQIPLTRTTAPNYVALRADYIPSGYLAIPATMEAVGNTIEIVLGTPAPLDTGAVPDVPANQTSTTWNIQSLYDWAGNTLSSTTPVSEPAGSPDIEF